MNKQDYIEEIANCIADSWLAADAGDQVARKAAKQGAMEIAKQAAENLGHTGRLLARRVPIPSSRPVLDLNLEVTQPIKSRRRLFSL